MLEFEHIVQVNDLNDKSIPILSRNQLWQGLVLRARNPEKFNRSLDCSSKPIAPNEFLRTIKVGDGEFCEHVVLFPEERIHTSTLEDQSQLNAESETSIEEPEAGYLFVRFRYKRDLEEDEANVNVGEHLKSAYVQMDRDAIAMIRMLAQGDFLGQAQNRSPLA